MGTLNGLVGINENGTWIIFNTNNSGLPNNYTNEIKEDSKGIIWIGASTAGGPKALCSYNSDISTSFPVNKRISAMTIDKQDQVWVGIDDEIKIFDGVEWRNDITDTMRTQNKYIDAMACDNYGRILFCVANKPYGGSTAPPGIYVYDPSDLSLKLIITTHASHINVTQNGNIWVCIWGKIGLLEPPTNIPILYKMDHQFNTQSYSMDSSTIPGFHLVSSAVQSNGDLWFAARYTGVIKFKGVDL